MTIYGPWTVAASISGAPSEYLTVYSSDQYSYPAKTTVFIYRGEGVRPLSAGKYTINVTVTTEDGSYSIDTAANPATLTVKPAALGIEARMVDDPSNRGNAIVTARFTGEFVESSYPLAYTWAPQKPTGTWTVVVKDSAGDVAVEKTIERTATDDSMATSFYWGDPKPGEKYTVAAVFAPSGEAAKNFAVSDSAPFDYTASTLSRPVPVSTVTEKPAAPPPDEPDFSVPLWWVLLIGAAFLALVTFTVIFAIRLARSPAPAPEQKATVS